MKRVITIACILMFIFAIGCGQSKKAGGDVTVTPIIEDHGSVPTPVPEIISEPIKISLDELPEYEPDVNIICSADGDSGITAIDFGTIGNAENVVQAIASDAYTTTRSSRVTYNNITGPRESMDYSLNETIVMRSTSEDDAIIIVNLNKDSRLYSTYNTVDIKLIRTGGPTDEMMQVGERIACSVLGGARGYALFHLSIEEEAASNTDFKYSLDLKDSVKVKYDRRLAGNIHYYTYTIDIAANLFANKVDFSTLDDTLPAIPDIMNKPAAELFSGNFMSDYFGQSSTKIARITYKTDDSGQEVGVSFSGREFLPNPTLNCTIRSGSTTVDMLDYEMIIDGNRKAAVKNLLTRGATLAPELKTIDVNSIEGIDAKGGLSGIIPVYLEDAKKMLMFSVVEMDSFSYVEMQLACVSE